MSDTTHLVQLAIYDLSQGMARTLSSQFLGPNHAIDIIPHTAILVYGREYYFGAGIACDDPHTFRQTRHMQPIEIQTLGRTQLSRTEFEQWCQSVTQDGTYGPASYDLLRRNCNNFSHDASLRGLKLKKGVPEWILNVPERFLSSPMGQMVRPMLEQMQITGPSPNSVTGSNFLSSVEAPDSRYSGTSTPANPWAHIGTDSMSTPPEKESKKQQPTPTTSLKDRIPALQQYTRPLISNDIKMVDTCVGKIIKDDNDHNKSLITRLGDGLKKANSPLDKDAVEVLVSKWKNGSSIHALYTLMLVRLAVLHPKTDNSMIVQSISAELTRNHDGIKGKPSVLDNASVRSMAWCVLSNIIGQVLTMDVEVPILDDAELESFIDAALLDLSPEKQQRVEVRQSASAFLYNLIISNHSSSILERKHDGGADEIPDTIVTILCGVTESINDEPDLTTKLRRILVIGKILCPSVQKEERTHIRVNETAVSLINNLGFTDIFIEMNERVQDSSDDGGKVAILVKEILVVLRDT